jgi:hypothetical protein
VDKWTKLHVAGSGRVLLFGLRVALKSGRAQAPTSLVTPIPAKVGASRINVGAEPRMIPGPA